ncbi:MAG: ABC transporter permease [Deltaproteobacteria bacterium]|nr:ABC transporter permease [Deltaproteobacteria bacterium]
MGTDREGDRRPGRAGRFLRRTAALAGKESLHVMRDPRTLYLALGMPVVLLVIFGFGVSFDMDDVPLAVVDQDHSAASRALAGALGGGGEFEVVARPADAGEVDRLFRSREASAAVVLPAGMQAAWDRGERVRVQVLLDGSDGTSASNVLGTAVGAIQAESSRRLAERTGGGAPPLAARVRLLFNPALRSAVFFVPGLIAYILYIVGVLLTALTVARENERGNLEQLFATPVGRVEVLLGKLLPYLAIGIVQALLVLAFGMVVFDVPLRGSVAVLGAGTVLFLVGALGQGLFISAITGSQQVATQAGALSSLLPGMLLSGFVIPVETMPQILQWISAIFPARYFVAILRGVMLKGNGLDVLWPNFVALGVFSVVAMTIATAKFKRGVG